MLFGEHSGDGLPLQKFQVCARTKKSAIVLVAAWQQLSQAFLDQSISEWWRRLENVVQCNGEHIEHVC